MNNHTTLTNPSHDRLLQLILSGARFIETLQHRVAFDWGRHYTPTLEEASSTYTRCALQLLRQKDTSLNQHNMGYYETCVEISYLRGDVIKPLIYEQLGNGANLIG